jgi:uncharacterized protein YdhG (YjbR/CyaY superfamily)
MYNFEEYLQTINEVDHREIVTSLFVWMERIFPQLDRSIKWNQAMFTHHNTFIIAFNPTKKHLAISPEKQGIERFSSELRNLDYEFGSMVFKIKWNQQISYDFLKRIIEFNIEDKINTTTFWR